MVTCVIVSMCPVQLDTGPKPHPIVNSLMQMLTLSESIALLIINLEKSVIVASIAPFNDRPLYHQ